MYIWKLGLAGKIALCMAVWLAMLAAEGIGARRGKGSVRTKTLRGIEAVRYLYSRRDYPRVEQFAYRLLWEDIRQPEVLYLLADSFSRQKKKEEACVYLTLLLRVWQEGGAPAGVTAYKKRVEGLLAVLNKDHERLKAAYARAASGKRFETPEKVDDLWMTQIEASLSSLHDLNCWKLVGGRKDLGDDWIHNQQGAMHRSGAKYMAEVHNRKGVLYCITAKKSKRLSRLIFNSPGKGKFLRVGARGQGFSFVLNVLVGRKQVFSHTVSGKSWEDLKVPLEGAAEPEDHVILEIVVPEQQRWHDCAFFDYVDFFDN